MGMPSGHELLEQVRGAQEALGAGATDEALEKVEPLVAATREAVQDIGFLQRDPADRTAVLEAHCYARVTAVLSLEAEGARDAPPRIRALAGESLDVGAGPAWKVLCAAAEMLSRCGDADGAVWAIRAAARLAPDEAYVHQVRASVRSMYPAAFSEAEA